jgi:ABC-2 type transport system permease protein
MSKYFVLFKTMLRNTFNVIDTKDKKNLKRILFVVFIGIATLPSIVSLGFLTREALFMLLPIQQDGLVISLLFLALSTMIFFMAIFLVPAVYYFSKDSETLLALPLTPEAIVLSKFSLSMVYEFLTIFVISTPIIIGYISIMNPNILFYLMLVVILLTIAVVPLAFAGLIIMVIMAFVPFFKNRDFFNYASGFLALTFAIGLNYVMGGTATLDQNSLIQLLNNGNNSLLGIMKIAFPNVPFAISALVNNNLLDFVIYLGITALVLVGFVFVSKLVYFKGVIGVNETSASRKNLNLKAYNKITSSKGVIFSYFIKEMKLMIRTPVYLLNNISTVILIPAILLVTLVSGVGADDEVVMLINSIDWSSGSILLIITFAGFVVGIMMSTMNLITVTSLSREGTNIYFMKLIPMSYVKQIQAKILSGVVVSMVGILFMLVPAWIFFKIQFHLIFFAFIASILGMIFMNYLGMIVDLIHPKLVWEQETAAVKNNLNSVFTMLPAFGVSFGIFFLVQFIPNTIGSVLLFLVLLLVLDLWIVQFTHKLSIKKLHALEV